MSDAKINVLRSYRSKGLGNSQNAATIEPQESSKSIYMEVDIRWDIVSKYNGVPIPSDTNPDVVIGIQGMWQRIVYYNPKGPFSFKARIKGTINWVYTVLSIRVSDDPNAKVDYIDGFMGTMLTSDFKPLALPKDILLSNGFILSTLSSTEDHTITDQRSTGHLYLNAADRDGITGQLLNLGMMTSFIAWHPQDSEDIMKYRDFFGQAGSGVKMYDIEFLQFHGYDTFILPINQTSSYTVNPNVKENAINLAAGLTNKKQIETILQQVVNSRNPANGIHVPIDMIGLYRQSDFTDKVADSDTWQWNKCFTWVNGKQSTCVKYNTDFLNNTPLSTNAF